MKILFVKPPLNPNIFTYTKYEPLEFEYLAASVPEHEVDIFDMRIEKNLMKKLRTFEPELVGTTAYTCDVNTSKRLLKEIKNFNPGIKTIIGGHHATFMPSDFAESYIDTIFIGYADRSFKEYIDALENGEDLESVANIGLVRDGKILFTERKMNPLDLNALPIPARHLTYKYYKKYHDSYGKRSALIMSSRGCPYRCTFCACWKLMDGKYATRNVEGVAEELKQIPTLSKIIDFSDDNTFHNIKRAWQLVEMIKKHGIERKYKMYARADTIVKNPKLFENFREIGLEYLTVGFESINDEGLEEINKKTSVEMNEEAIRILKKLGIYVDAHFIIYPRFTKDDFSNLFKYVDEHCLFRNTFAVLTPLPGTNLYAENLEDLALRDYDYFDFGHSIFKTHLSRKDFYRQLANIYRKAYAPGRIFRYKLHHAQKVPENPDDFYAYNTDGFTFWMLVLMYIVAMPNFIKMLNIHKSEPIRN
jgi:radical SAM superfamily enzyme YgiQ (UPF0313 family)